jgi:hypothetical protein
MVRRLLIAVAAAAAALAWGRLIWGWPWGN